ncbi:hypothetical protein [Thalassoglobus polymorphus]|uniref:hypothetical protein n=1 Tax=Thalassoglobus polymorphus TaxID=2527994 RepID=UPI001E2C9C68|nr:hypothetical protein [Thalassoglobus polymorphus]
MDNAEYAFFLTFAGFERSEESDTESGSRADSSFTKPTEGQGCRHYSIVSSRLASWSPQLEGQRCVV